MRRTNTCGELTKKDVGKKVVLDGWTQSRRDHGGLIFIDLRDRHGLTQIVFDPSHNKDTHKMAEHIGREFVLEIKGKIRNRKSGMINPKLKTGEIEVLVDELKIINKSKTPPIEIDDRIEAGEETRLKYRYLDLRRPIMQKRIALRHKIVTTARDYFNKHDFIEITTPMLVKSTLRDEDLRTDRQPEHMQFDFEMSFVTSDDIREFTEGLYKHLFKEVLNIKLDKFPVFTYKEAMEMFGVDKPDIRFGLELIDVTDIVKKSDFSVFKKVEAVKCINPEKDLSRKELDKYIDFCQKNGANGMAWMRVTNKGLESSIVKYFSTDVQKELLKRTKAKKESILMFVAGTHKTVNENLGKLRLKLRDDLNLVKKQDFKMCWVKDFPLFSWNEDKERWDPEHHMFTMPKQEFVKDFEKRPGEVIGDLWDLVLNGTELGSGSIRVTSPELQERIMKFIGMTKEEAKEKFGFLLEAYEYGGPVHGGMGLGLDRTVALMACLHDIREIIAFPKNKAAQCPMDGSPSDVDETQLKELHIKSTFIKKKPKEE